MTCNHPFINLVILQNPIKIGCTKCNNWIAKTKDNCLVIAVDKKTKVTDGILKESQD